LALHRIDPASEKPFANDGWSGATLTRLRDDDGRPYVLKRDSLERDWIARATKDRPLLREAWFAIDGPPLPWPVRNPALGAARTAVDGQVAILMPDLSDVLFDWNAPLTRLQLDAVLAALVALHGVVAADVSAWTGWKDRVTLICRPSLERRGPAHDAVADRLLPGWDAWDRVATPAARRIIADLAADVEPLLDAMAAGPSSLIHGDLKLANAGIARDGAVEMVDWQMVAVAPVGVELGWFLVANVNALPLPPQTVLDRYWTLRGQQPGTQNDIAILVGLLLRGWRKGLDAEAGLVLASGASAVDDLAWWCERAVEAADRIL
ncbi:MAG: phosphotransferase, partial [Candidatus Limnocylindrales bacterium]